MRMADNNFDRFVIVSGEKGSGKSTLVIMLIQEYLSKFSFVCPNCNSIFYKSIYAKEQTEHGYRFYIPKEILDNQVLIKCPMYYELNMKTGLREKVSGCGCLFPLSRRRRLKYKVRDFVAYNNDEAYNTIIRANVGKPVQCDEAITFMSSLDFNKTESKEMKRLFTVIRPRRLLTFALAPEFSSIDRRYRDDFSHYWMYVFERGHCIVFEKNKAVSDDKYSIKNLQKIMPVLKYFTPTDKIIKALKRHPCFFDYFKFDELDAKTYDEYELYRNASNIRKAIQEQEFSGKELQKLIAWNTMTHWDSVAIEVARQKDRKMTYGIFCNHLLRNPLSTKAMASEPTVRNWVRAIDQWVKTKGENVDAFVEEKGGLK